MSVVPAVSAPDCAWPNVPFWSLMGTDMLWEVIGGAERGGILVREGAELKSTEVQPRLGVGQLHALV